MKNKIIFELVILLLLLKLSCLKGHNNKNLNIVFIDFNSKCSKGCGQYSNPFSNFKEALLYLKNSENNDCDWFDWNRNMNFNEDIPIIVVNPGSYTGEKNINLNVDFDVQIFGYEGSEKTILDCKFFGNSLSISTKFFYLKGFTIKNCHSNYGGAINLTNTNSIIEDVIFYNNYASYGGAIATYLQTTSILDCSFIGNSALENGGAIYSDGLGSVVRVDSSEFNCNSNISKIDIFTSQAIISIDSDTNVRDIGISCKSPNLVIQDDISKCNTVAKQCSSNITNPNPNQEIIFKCNNNGICDMMSENCLSCPSDCSSCKFQGFKLTSYIGLVKTLNETIGNSFQTSVQQIQNAQVVNFMDGQTCPLSGHLTAYIKVLETQVYEFKLSAFNLGAKLLLNGISQIDQFFPQNYFNTVRSIKLSSKNPNKLDILFFSTSAYEKNITLLWRKEGEEEWELTQGFYSLNICNDGILDPLEKNKNTPFYCPVDIGIYFSSNVTEYGCGDGICNEPPESCIIDCYELLSESCPGKAPTQSTQYLKEKDTIGILLNNQYLYSLPGIHHLRHGVDFKTRKQRPSSIFSFDYCDSSSYSIIQDFTRSLVYTIPKELFATISRQCNFETSSEISSKSSDFSRTMAEEAGFSVSTGIGGGTSFIQASVSLAFSEEESIKKSQEFARTEKGEIIKTDIKCQSSKVQFNSFKFSQSFLKDIGRATTIEHCKKLILKYGSFYYKNAVLGGTLTQVTIIKSDSQSSMSSLELSKYTEKSIEAAVNSKMFSVSGSYSDSTDSQITGEQQESFESNSKRSNLMVKGGPVGAFTPGEDAKDFQYWASNIDLLPVPVSYQLGYVSDIIPTTWKIFNSSDLTLRSLWIDAEDSLLNDYVKASDLQIKGKLSRENTTIMISFTDSIYYGEITLNYTKLVEGEVKSILNTLFMNDTLREFEVPSINEIISIQLSNSSGLLNQYHNIEILDYSQDRIYLFQKVPSNSSLGYQNIPGNLIQLSFQVNGTLDPFNFLEIEIQGEYIFHKDILSLEGFSNIIVTIPMITDGYIGRIINVYFKVWGDISKPLSIGNLTIYHSCPSPTDSSGCTPSSLFSQESNFIRLYQKNYFFDLMSYQIIKISI